MVGPQVKEMISRCREGDLEAARALNDEVQPALAILKVTTNPIAIKAALNMLGHEVGGLRLPLVEASDEELAEIRSGLERAGLTTPARV